MEPLWGAYRGNFTTMCRRIGFIGVGKGKSGTDINGSKDIALKTWNKDRDSVHLNEVTRLPWGESLPSVFLFPRLLLPHYKFIKSGVESNFVWLRQSALLLKVMDYPAYRWLWHRLNAGTVTGQHQNWCNSSFISYGCSALYLIIKSKIKGWTILFLLWMGGLSPGAKADSLPPACFSFCFQR